MLRAALGSRSLRLVSLSRDSNKFINLVFVLSKTYVYFIFDLVSIWSLTNCHRFRSSRCWRSWNKRANTEMNTTGLTNLFKLALWLNVHQLTIIGQKKKSFVIHWVRIIESARFRKCASRDNRISHEYLRATFAPPKCSFGARMKTIQRDTPSSAIKRAL